MQQNYWQTAPLFLIFHFCFPFSFQDFESLRAVISIWLMSREAEPHVHTQSALNVQKQKSILLTYVWYSLVHQDSKVPDVQGKHRVNKLHGSVL